MLLDPISSEFQENVLVLLFCSRRPERPEVMWRRLMPSVVETKTIEDVAANGTQPPSRSPPLAVRSLLVVGPWHMVV